MHCAPEVGIPVPVDLINPHDSLDILYKFISHFRRLKMSKSSKRAQFDDEDEIADVEVKTQLPKWVESDADRMTVGMAQGFEAPPTVLADRYVCLGFIQAKKEMLKTSATGNYCF